MIKPNYYTSYKGIWYKYVSQNDTWRLSNSQYDNATVMIFPGKYYRIDQCLEAFIKNLKNP